MLSPEDINRIAIMKDEGLTWRQISRILGCSRCAARKAFQRFRSTQMLPPLHKKSRAKLNGRYSLFVKRSLRENPRLSTRKLVKMLTERFSTTFSQSCVSRFLRKEGFNLEKAKRKIVISEKNRKLRLDFALIYLGRAEFLETMVVWSDETLIRACPFGRETRYYRRAGDPKITQPKIQGGKFSVMFWGWMSPYGFGRLVIISGKINAQKYQEVLEREFVDDYRLLIEAAGTELVFMQDNALVHTAKSTIRFLDSMGIKRLDWPPQSPDINPIELVWNIIKDRLYREYPIAESRAQLIDFVMEIWSSLDKDLAQRLCRRVGEILPRVVKAKGGLYE